MRKCLLLFILLLATLVFAVVLENAEKQGNIQEVAINE